MLHRRTVSLLAVLSLTVAANVTHSQAPAKDKYGDPLPPDAVTRLGTVRLRHDAAVVFAAFLPGGKSILSVGRDGVMCVWEFPSGKELRRRDIVPATERGAGTTARV